MTLTINEIKLNKFRNIEELSLSNIGKLTIFVGPNAAGKTNIIEAIRLTTALTALNNSGVEQLVMQGFPQSIIETIIRGDGRDIAIKLILNNEGKNYFINEKKKSPKEIRGILPSVCFVPDDLVLIKGAQSIKRKSLDVFGSQASSNYQTIKKDYEKILNHKNSFLKEEKNFSQELLLAINETLITSGVQFHLYRRSLLYKLIPYIKSHYLEITGKKEEVEVSYIPSWESDLKEEETSDKELIKNSFREALKQKASEEKSRHRALIGPHADKINFTINGKDAAIYGSQGQQRSLVLALKLAEVDVIEEIKGKKPVLLLDDVMSELDKDRRSALLEFIQGKIQTFITTTHLEYFPKEILNKAHIINLSSYGMKEKE